MVGKKRHDIVSTWCPTRSAMDCHVPLFSTQLIGLVDLKQEETHRAEPSGAHERREKSVFSDAPWSGSVTRSASAHDAVSHRMSVLSDPVVARYFIKGSKATPLTKDS